MAGFCALLMTWHILYDGYHVYVHCDILTGPTVNSRKFAFWHTVETKL